MTKLKAIFHVDEPEKWGLLLANVSNLLNDLGKDNIEIIVLANAAAVGNYVPDQDNDKVLTQLDELSQEGVIFKACRNALAANKIDEVILPKVIEVVPAGVTELVRKQAEGYGYIKP